MGQTTSEYRKQVTERLIGMLESGTAPWQKPWDAGIAAMNRPHNFNGRPYHGVNALMLWCTAIDKGYEDPRWLTFNQVKKLGGHVNKGEKSQLVEYWQWEKEVENPETGEKEKVPLPHPKVFRAMVFNADQCSGLPPLERPVQKWTPHERADRIVAANGVQVMHSSGEGAFYSPGGDYICLPPKESFPTEDAYYSTLLHEVGHSTGHPARLNREFSGRFGSENYAKEELRAELASTFLCGELGIATTGSDEQHAAYVKSWVSALQDDYNEIFRAAADAEKICNYLYDREKEYLKAQEQGKAMVNEPAEKEQAPVMDDDGFVDVQMAQSAKFRGKIAIYSHDAIYMGDSRNYLYGTYDNGDDSLVFVSKNPLAFDLVTGRDYPYTAQELIERGKLTKADLQEMHRLNAKLLAATDALQTGELSFKGVPFNADENVFRRMTPEEYAQAEGADNVQHKTDAVDAHYDYPYRDLQTQKNILVDFRDYILENDFYTKEAKAELDERATELGYFWNSGNVQELLDDVEHKLEKIYDELNAPATKEQIDLLKQLKVTYPKNITAGDAEVKIFVASAMANEEETKMAKDEKSALMPASDAQKGYLVSLGVEFKDDITKGDADRMIKERVAKRNEYFEKANSPATEGQKKTLIASGKNFDENITFGEASKVIGKLHATVEQMDFMDKLKVQYGKDVTRDEASKLIEQKLRASEARDNEPATDKQRATLIAHGQEVTDDMTRREASAAIYFSPATEAQLNYLVDHEIKFDPEKICYGSAGRIIEERENKRFESRARPATENQLKYLSDNEIPHDKSITLGQAYDLIKHHKAELDKVTPAQLKKAEELGIEVPDTMKRTELTEKIAVTTKENAIKEYDAGDNSKTDVVSKYMELAQKQFAKTGDFSKFDDKKIAAELLKQGIDKDKVRSAVMLHSPVNRKFDQVNELVNAAAKQPSVQKAMAAKAKEAEMGR